MYKLVIIVVNWNGGEKVVRCIDSIFQMISFNEFMVIVVDNHSSDGSPERIQERYDKVVLIRNRENLGFTKGNNIGLKYVRRRRLQTGYFLFLNNDTELEDESLDRAIDFMDNRLDVAGLTPCIVESDGAYQTGVGGKQFNLVNMAIYYFFLNHLPFLKAQGINLNQGYYDKRKKMVEMDWISGTAMLVRSTAVPHDLFFSEQYFMYAEDLAFSDCLRKIGRLFYYPFFRVKHHRRFQPRGIDLYFNSLFSYLSRKGFTPLKLKLIKLIIYKGLVCRYSLFRALGMWNERWKTRARVNKFQIEAIKRLDLKSLRGSVK